MHTVRTTPAAPNQPARRASAALSAGHAARATVAALVALIAANGAPSPVQGQQRAPGTDIVRPADQARADAQHPEVLAAFGGAVDGPVQTYVAGLGARVAQTAGLDGLCRFQVLNSDAVNAFAVPGCRIYVTRGLLSAINSEDELVSVLGHEVGHIVGKHGLKRQQRAGWANLGALVAGIATGNRGILQLAGQLAAVYTLSYSREQEFQSDDFGVRYTRALGYNPLAAADMLASLGLQESLEAVVHDRVGRSAPTWARSHPLSADRAQRATAQARNGAVAPFPAERAAPYFRAIDGLLHGDDPEQGFIIGRAFAHPGLRLAFEAPAGFQLANSPQAVQISGPDGIRGQFAGGGAAPRDLRQHANEVLARIVGTNPHQAGPASLSTTGGVETARQSARVRTANGTVAAVEVAAYRIGNRVFHMVFTGPDGRLAPAVVAMSSVRSLSAAEASGLRPRRIEIVTVRAGDTPRRLAERMAYPDFRLERFLALNGMPLPAAGAVPANADTPLAVGTQVKIVALTPAVSARLAPPDWRGMPALALTARPAPGAADDDGPHGGHAHRHTESARGR